MRLTILTPFLGVCAATMIFGCDTKDSSQTYRYKMAVEVDTPSGVKSGFSVQEHSVITSNIDFGEMSPKRALTLRGEAVVVDLSDGQSLFVLLCDPRLTQSVIDPKWDNDWRSSAQRIISGDIPSGPKVMREDRPRPAGIKSGLPLFVKFGDARDPKSVEVVNPTDLAASFGPGVRLKRIFLEVTSEKVSSRLGQRLRAMNIIPGQSLDRVFRPTSSPTLAQALSYNDFRKGID